MVTKFFLRPVALPFTIFSTAHPFIIPKPSLPRRHTIVSTLLSTAASSHAINAESLPYGPSLCKGSKPSQSPIDNNPKKCEEDIDGDCVINEEEFTRVFDIAALRVSARDCFALESRLRGHLLNWPRIPNIARVPGDEMEEVVASVLGNSDVSEEEDDERKLDALNRRVYGRAETDGDELSPVLYRERLARDFNSKGFVKFRSLARMSRPKRSKSKDGRGEEREGNGSKRKDEFAVVEVVEEEDGEGGDWKGLLGDEFEGSRKWKGSTRLLLLDETYTEKKMEELPLAIKAVLQEAMGEKSPAIFELVRCRLTLFYDYWQMNEILEALLPKDMIIPSAFETVGHIAHLNLKDELLPYKKLVAKVILDKNKPKIKTVINKIDAIHNDYRTMQLEVLAGNHSLVTMVVENGLRFHVDLATVYWNSRLATERQRLLNGFTCYDVVCDVFSGVGPIAISAAKIVKRIYANDLNPHAVDYLARNSVLNKLEKKIEVFNMDGRRFINAMFASEKALSVTQVVMNLPNDAVEYLDAFKGIFKDKPKDKELILPMIHVYGFSKASDPEFEFHERIRISLREVAVDVQMRRVRLVAPGKWMLCASFRLPASVAYASTKQAM